MKINWKLRFQNKTTLIAILLGVVALAYQVIRTLGFVPSVAENDVVQVVKMIVDLLVLLGVVVDPTTSGVSDSEQALNYKEPK